MEYWQRMQKFTWHISSSQCFLNDMNLRYPYRLYLRKSLWIMESSGSWDNEANVLGDKCLQQLNFFEQQTCDANDIIHFGLRNVYRRYGASQCGPRNNALNPTLGLKTSFIALISRYIPLHTIGANHFYKGGNQKRVPFWFLRTLESFVTPPLNS